jgi:hypothetical protein
VSSKKKLLRLKRNRKYSAAERAEQTAVLLYAARYGLLVSASVNPAATAIRVTSCSCLLPEWWWAAHQVDGDDASLGSEISCSDWKLFDALRKIAAMTERRVHPSLLLPRKDMFSGIIAELRSSNMFCSLERTQLETAIRYHVYFRRRRTSPNKFAKGFSFDLHELLECQRLFADVKRLAVDWLQADEQAKTVEISGGFQPPPNARRSAVSAKPSPLIEALLEG